MRTVAAGDSHAQVERGQGIPGDHAVELGMAQCAEHGLPWLHDQFGGEHGLITNTVGSIGHSRQRDRFVGIEGTPKFGEEWAPHQSSGSTSTWSVPPHVSPTSSASSSE